MNRRCLGAALLLVAGSPTLFTQTAIAQSDPASGAQEDAQEDAQEKVEEIVVIGQLNRYGATKSDIPIVETARSISVVLEEQFRDRGALTLDDTVAYTAGTTGDSFGFSTRGDFVKVRGFNAAEYRDGQQVLFGYYNNTRSEVYLLEQVEVLKGPASVLYGKGSPGGIVNAISKIAGPGHTSEVVLDAGSFSRKQIATDLNARAGDNLYLRAVGLYRDSDTQIDHINDDAIAFMPSLTFQNERTSVTAMFEYVHRKTDTAHQFMPINATGCLSDQISVSPASFCDNASSPELEPSAYMGNPNFNLYDSSSTLVSLLGSHQLSDQWAVEGVTRFKNSDMNYNQAWVDFNGAGVPRVDVDGNGLRTYYLSDAGSEQLALDLRLRGKFATGSLAHEMVFGLAYQDVETDNDTIYVASADSFNVHDRINDAIPSALQGEPADSPASLSEDKGIYVNDQISIANWKINFGVRYDDTESGTEGSEAQTDSEWSTSVGVLYAFANGLSPYLTYAESFEPVLGTDGLTNEPLAPRRGELKEVGLKYQPSGSASYVTAAYFDIEESNLPNPASLIGEPDSQQEGVGSSTGVEVEGSTRLGDFVLNAALTLMDTEDANGHVFSSTPEQQFSVWLDYEPGNGLRTGLGVRLVGENESNGVHAITGEAVEVVTDGYTTLDAMVGYALDNWDFTLSARNLADEAYYSTCLARGDCYPGEQRSVLARAAYRF